jgi:hypothetical protein
MRQSLTIKYGMDDDGLPFGQSGNPETTGVLAGELIDTSITAARVRRALSEEGNTK